MTKWIVPSMRSSSFWQCWVVPWVVEPRRIWRLDKGHKSARWNQCANASSHERLSRPKTKISRRHWNLAKIKDLAYHLRISNQGFSFCPGLKIVIYFCPGLDFFLSSNSIKHYSSRGPFLVHYDWPFCNLQNFISKVFVFTKWLWIFFMVSLLLSAATVSWNVMPDKFQ